MRKRAKESKVTLVKIRLSDRRIVFWRQLSIVVGMLAILCGIFVVVGVVQYVFCRQAHPGRSLQKCIAPLLHQDKPKG